MHSFEYEGVTITLKQPTGRDYVKLNRLKSIAQIWDYPTEERAYIVSALHCLYLVTDVQGDLGFPIPYKDDATYETITAFCNGLLNYHESLISAWDSAWLKVKYPEPDDPDLAPPQVMEKKDSATQKSKKSD